VDVTAVQGNVVTISEAGVNSTVEERFNNSTPAVCALLDTGVVQCWHGSELTEFAAEKYTKMSSGIFNTLCLVNSSGALKCLGPNPYGEVDGTGEPRNEPVSIAGIEGGIVDIAIGGQHTCAITERGVLLCWGNNANNKITPTGGVMIYPPRSPLMATMWEGLVRKAGAGYEFTCAIVGDGDVTCWGVPGPQLGLGYRWGSGIPGWYGVGCCWLVVGFGGDPPHGFCQPPSP
jgi:alpha-tubulin suppressor-like RCC1 family protein